MCCTRDGGSSSSSPCDAASERSRPVATPWRLRRRLRRGLGGRVGDRAEGVDHRGDRVAVARRRPRRRRGTPGRRRSSRAPRPAGARRRRRSLVVSVARRRRRPPGSVTGCLLMRRPKVTRSLPLRSRAPVTVAPPQRVGQQDRPPVGTDPDEQLVAAAADLEVVVVGERQLLGEHVAVVLLLDPQRLAVVQHGGGVDRRRRARRRRPAAARGRPARRRPARPAAPAAGRTPPRWSARCSAWAAFHRSNHGSVISSGSSRLATTASTR